MKISLSQLSSFQLVAQYNKMHILVVHFDRI